jgi:hypothetical protein
VPELKRLHAGHAPAVLAFELANRAYFAASVSDRGDEFYNQFADRHSALLAEQEAGIGAFYVLVADDGSVLGRFNLYNVEDGTAELGYRVAARRRPRCGDRDRPGAVPAGGSAAWTAHTAGSHRPRQCRVPEGADQGRVRPGRTGRPGRPRR